jgi:hypothetical protein
MGWRSANDRWQTGLFPGVVHFNPVAVGVFEINLLHAVHPRGDGLRLAGQVFKGNTCLVEAGHKGF